MPVTTRSIAQALAILGFVAASGCGSTSDDVAVPVTTEAATAPTTVTEAPATTVPATSTTTTSTTASASTTTTTLPSTLDIDGSPLIEFSVEVDDALTDQFSQAELVAFVVETLSDERSWIGRGAGFRLVDDGGLFTIIVATPTRTDQLCWPLQTNGRFSCARNGWVAINSDRWLGATNSWPADLETYRRYVINHEIGHYILGAGHATCPDVGRRAPVMMQQTKGLGGCIANGWGDP